MVGHDSSYSCKWKRHYPMINFGRNIFLTNKCWPYMKYNFSTFTNSLITTQNGRATLSPI